MNFFYIVIHLLTVRKLELACAQRLPIMRKCSLASGGCGGGVMTVNYKRPLLFV